MIVYKLSGESYELMDDPYVYDTRERAIEELQNWEVFLGMPVQEALDEGIVEILEYGLVT